MTRPSVEGLAGGVEGEAETRPAGPSRARVALDPASSGPVAGWPVWCTSDRWGACVSTARARCYGSALGRWLSGGGSLDDARAWAEKDAGWCARGITTTERTDHQ